MSDMKCPFCQQEMICGGTICHYNPDCPIHDNPVPTEILELLDRTSKALGYAINVIQTVAKMSDKLSKEYGETLVEQLDNIQAYCWQEGYVLTHKEDLERAITTAEQKDAKCQQEQI